MKLSILGVNGPFPAAGGATSAYALERGGKWLLVDIGSGALSRLSALVAPEALSGLVITHFHADHISDLGVLGYLLEQKKRMGALDGPLAVFSPPVPDYVKASLPAGVFEFLEVDENAHPALLGYEASFCKTAHPAPCFALRLGGFVFTGDTTHCPALVPFCRDADLLLCDAAFEHIAWTDKLPHLSARLAGELARDAGVRRLIITHFAPSASVPRLLDEAKAVFANTHAAHPGDVWMIE